ncbi:Helix-turn-helix domain-containing protein [Paenibacillus tianmuensis]|uniref:Helix-turn-helix domain-containing protein n=1 Tax=Paenibacillus tianmuensis TaxID=624147 RepID=A0A1G4RGZ9_9BACL|nr:helix-turn-helix domain-containing protein [Paenibacillus tianmuensis]SCW56242.1 Helix-turn-helix domain-containing protein [Paenibacillus tianmuensis]
MSEDQRRLELGRFLRSRRVRLSPETVGLQHFGMTRRKTKGLRREEVAALAGISLPWYTFLEQGRDINVSDQVLESLARVLRLNQDEQDHLFFLSNPRRMKEIVSDENSITSTPLRYMLDQMSLCPAYISDEKMNILALNGLASLVFGPFEEEDGHKRNMIWRMFMLESYRVLVIRSRNIDIDLCFPNEPKEANCHE